MTREDFYRELWLQAVIRLGAHSIPGGLVIASMADLNHYGYQYGFLPEVIDRCRDALANTNEPVTVLLSDGHHGAMFHPVPR
jgi:hypothetical protein